MQMMTLLQETAKSRGKDDWKNDFFLIGIHFAWQWMRKGRK